MGQIAIIFAVGVLLIFFVMPVLMDTILVNYPVGQGYKAYNSWKEFMRNFGWFYYLLSIPLAAVAYIVGNNMEGGGVM